MTRELRRKLDELAIECEDTYSMANRTEDMLEEIFNEHEAQLKAKESDLERQDMIIRCLNIDLDNKEKLLKAKDEEIERLKAQYHQCLDDYIKCAERKDI